MNRALMAVGVCLALGLCARGKEYVVYKAAYSQTFDYHYSGGRWYAQPDKYTGYFIMEVSGTKAVALDRALVFECWKEGSVAYYDTWVTTWFRLVELAGGQMAIVAYDVWAGVPSFYETVLLTGVSMGGPPKAFAGVHFTIVTGNEIEREEAKLRLDTKLTAAAQAAADAAPGDPLLAVQQAVADYLDSRGYVEDR